MLLLSSLALCVSPAKAALFAEVSGVVHDVQHHPLAASEVRLQARNSARLFQAQTNANGEFQFAAVPFGEYTLTVTHAGFGTVAEPVTVSAGTSAVLHIALPVATVQESVNVQGQTDGIATASAMPTVLLGQTTIEDTPGADRSNSLAMITDYVPGAYITHDMLHMRGGHQVSWLLDGVEIPNTNIASNLGPQIDPRDIDYLQIDRGSYTADMGDRTYGVFDVNPKSGFARDREGQLIATAGSALETDEQISFGDHSARGAYYVSLNGNRSDYGLSPPVERASHDAENGYGGFASLLFNKDAKDQLRLLLQLRSDFFQIPYDPNGSDYENQLYDSSGLRDAQHERDGVVAFTWSHSVNPGTVFTVSPFFHYNSADYQPNANDTPTATTSDRASTYAGVQASASGAVARNHLEGGFYAWGQHDRDLFAVGFNDASAENFRVADQATGGLVEEYVSDNYKPVRLITLTAGLRVSTFSGSGFEETAVYPRLGAAVEVPKLRWVFRGFYGHFYQPPPLVTVAGPVLGYALGNDTSLAPLHGERDEEHQFGVQIPLPGRLQGWVMDADTFKTEASNFLDHSNIGESSISIPVTIAGALIQGWELTLRSPGTWRRGGVHLAYSNQIAKQRGAITGGLVCFPVSSPQCDVEPGYTPLDHDQRNTLNVGGEVRLPMGVGASTNVYYGSGFANGFPGPPSPYSGAYLPSHTTFDLQFTRKFGENVTISVNSTNVANRRVLLDNSLTFGGFHENDPRQIYGELRYRFHY
ncbi:MAG: TonB-dependent receptor [Janthinobacterium lividum]